MLPSCTHHLWFPDGSRGTRSVPLVLVRICMILPDDLKTRRQARPEGRARDAVSWNILIVLPCRRSSSSCTYVLLTLSTHLSSVKTSKHLEAIKSVFCGKLVSVVENSPRRRSFCFNIRVGNALFSSVVRVEWCG